MILGGDRMDYIIYWLISTPHCDEAKEVLQVDGKIAYVCRHDV